MLQSINPTYNQVIQNYEEYSLEQINKIIEQCNEAFHIHLKSNFSERASHLVKVSEILKRDKRKLAELITLEMGKPILQSIAEVEKCAWVCDYYAESGERFLSDELIQTDASKSYVSFQPLGVILAIMPWNFPFWQVFRFAAPSLMAGNTAVLKHSSNVSGCALAIEDIFNEAGFIENTFRTILISSKGIEEVIKNPLIKAITLTGSTNAGSSVASIAGKYIKKTVLELGGSDPYIILKDANLEEATETCVNARLINNGQSCIAAKRFIIVENVYDEFENLFLKKMIKKKMGDPLNEKVDLGPQARMDLRDDLINQVQRSIEQGAKLILGGNIPESKGSFYPPTILTEVKKGMPAFDEELFGPVAPLIKVKDEKEAIRVANYSSFGLGAAIFTNDLERGELIAKEQIQAGSCFVNLAVKSDPRLPFGGINQSGYGRELSSFGIREFVNIKTVFIK